MAVSVTHSTVVVTPDDGTSEVGTDEWNAAHTVTGAAESATQVIAGAGLTGGGTLEADRTLNVGAGTGITVNADDVALDAAHAANALHPASSTDNAIARYDSTAGALQNGGAFLDDSGRILLNQATAQGVGGATMHLQLQGTGTTLQTIERSSMAGILYGDHVQCANWLLVKSRSTTPGAFTVVADGDNLGRLSFYGDDGDQFLSAASIEGQVDGSPANNDMPGRLVFATTSDGGTFPTERMRITSGGHVIVPSLSSDIVLGHTAPISNGGATRKFQIHATSATTSGGYNTYWANDVQGAYLDFFKSRGATVGSHTIVQAGDILGAITFRGSDGADFADHNAEIQGKARGTPASGSIPAQLDFYTQKDGDAATSLTFSINADGLGNFASNGILHTASDAGFDVLYGWDDGAATYKSLLLADIATEASPAAGDFVLIYGAEGDVRKANWNTLPGTGGGISNVVEDLTPQLGGDLDLNTFDILASTGTVINFDGGDVTITHSANTLTVVGGSLVLPAAGLTVGASVPFSDAAGTLTLQNVDALDGTTESTIEAAIDTLANLTSVQGRTVTLADAGFDVLLGWDDSGSAYKNFALADITAEGTPASGDFFLMYGAEGDLRRVDFDDMPGAGGGIDNVVDLTPQLGGDLDANTFDILFDDNTGIRDDSDNEQLIFQKTASAVNHLEITNAATGNAPSLATAGGDTDINLHLIPQGAGIIKALADAFQVQDAASMTKGYRFRTNGGGLDVDYCNADLIISTFPNVDFGGTQVGMLGLSEGGDVQIKPFTATPAGGSTAARVGIGSTAGFGVYVGSGAPTVSAPKGSLYLRSDGSGAGDRMYVNTDGSTTWTNVVTAA